MSAGREPYIPPELRGADGRWWTEGHRLYLTIRGKGAERTNHKTLAVQINVSAEFVGQVLDRKERPGFGLAYRMWKVHGISMESWHEPARARATEAVLPSQSVHDEARARTMGKSTAAE